MIPKLWNLSRNLRPSAPILPRKLRPFAPQPSGRQRLGESLRLVFFNNCMLNPFSTLKNKLSRRRVRVSSTSSPPAKLPFEPALPLHGMLVASYHVLLGHVWTFHPFSLFQGASPSEQVSVPRTPSPPVPEHSPRPKWWHPSPDPADVSPPGRTTSKATPEGTPSSKQQEVMPLHKALT